MGAWGTSITSNDTAKDLYIEYVAAFYKYDVEEALKRIDDYVREDLFDESDAEAIRYLVYNTSACVSDSNVVLDTIRAAMSAYVGGVYSAEETAAQLQSRISIYLAEQFG